MVPVNQQISRQKRLQTTIHGGLESGWWVGGALDKEEVDQRH